MQLMTQKKVTWYIELEQNVRPPVAGVHNVLWEWSQKLECKHTKLIRCATHYVLSYAHTIMYRCRH